MQRQSSLLEEKEIGDPFAIDSRRRAWGFASKDSDFDAKKNKKKEAPNLDSLLIFQLL